MIDARQLTLDWPHAPSLAREDFLVAPSNAPALRAIEAWRDWPGGVLLLVGPSGSGKSHLGAIWARDAAALAATGAHIDALDLAALPDHPRLLIDDADQGGAHEAAFFHALNAVRERGGSVLMTAAQAPGLWGVKTPDLLSRLRLAPAERLRAPDLDLIRVVLFKLFADRQLIVDASLVNYLAPRLERSIAAARAVVAALDHEALSRGRKITRAIAAQVLALDEDAED